MNPLSPNALLCAWETASAAIPSLRGAALLAASTGLPWNEACDLPLGELTRRLLRLRAAQFGDTVAALVDCPRCSGVVELHFRTTDFTSAAVTPGPIRAEACGLHLELRSPTSRDLYEITRATQVPATAAEQLFRLCLVTAHDANGQPLTPEHFGADPAARTAAEQALAHADPHADLRLGLACPHCRHEWEAPFDPASFLLFEFAAEAKRLLRDVHDLAAAYGWSESEILALSPSRRAAYLEMVRA